jgi:hypothetical protein
MLVRPTEMSWRGLMNSTVGAVEVRVQLFPVSTEYLGNDAEHAGVVRSPYINQLAISACGNVAEPQSRSE